MDFIVNFQNSLFYDFIRNAFACIFYVLLIFYVFTKIYNVFLAKKLNCKEKYKEKAQEFSVNTRKLLKNLAKFLLFFLIGCLLIGLIIFFINIVILIFTGFGTALSSTDNLFLNFAMNFMNISSQLLLCGPILLIFLFALGFYVISYILLIDGISKNIKIKACLKETF